MVSVSQLMFPRRLDRIVMDQDLKDEIISILAERIAYLEIDKAILIAKARKDNEEWDGDGKEYVMENLGDQPNL